MLHQLTRWYHSGIAEVEEMRRVGIASRAGLVFLETLITCSFAFALCGTDVVIVKGRVAQPNQGSSSRRPLRGIVQSSIVLFEV